MENEAAVEEVGGGSHPREASLPEESLLIATMWESESVECFGSPHDGVF